MLKKIKSIIKRYRRARLIIIGYGFFASGGAWRSIYQYYQHMSMRGQKVMLITRPWRHSSRQMLMAFFFGNCVLFNGLDSFFYLDSVLFCLIRRDAIVYLHETAFIFAQFQKHHPLLYRLVRRIVRRNRICCVSRRQEAFLREEFGARYTHVIYESIVPNFPEALDTGRTNIVMVGTIDPRKGATLFSQVADHAHELGRDWEFIWIGSAANTRDVYLSERVRWLGAKPDVYPFLSRADLFLLSSIDDPFPLACLEALSLYRKCVVYRNTGLAEVLDGVQGCAVYEDYTVDAVTAAIDRALTTELDHERIRDINERISSVPSFTDRMETVLDEHSSRHVSNSPPAPSRWPPSSA